MRPEIIAIMSAFMIFFGVALSVVGSKNDRITTLENRITTLENEAISRGHMMYCPKTGNLDWIENCEKVE